MAQLRVAVYVCALAAAMFGQPAQTSSSARSSSADQAVKFPVKRVVLYKNGVGYFEHLGRIQENQDVTIQFTSGQLNDVLKSLTVLDLNGGRITGVNYHSSTPVDKRLGELRIPAGEKTTLTEFLSGLRGARLEVRSAGAVLAGRLLSIERKTRMGGGTTLEVDYVSLITDAGEVKTTELSSGFSVRLLERGLAGQVERYMDVLASARDADLRPMTISTAGSGERSMFVSYISEVPVWKTTYRMVLSSKSGLKPLLQGWAIVDNTVGEDWDKVDLSLVAGAPHSFIQRLSVPYYSRRPVVPLPESLASLPQAHEATLNRGSARLTGVVNDPTGAPVAGARVRAFDEGGAIVGETFSNAAGRYALGGLPEGEIRLEVYLAGFRPTTIRGINVSADRPAIANARLDIGSVSEATEVRADAPGVQTESASLGRSAGSSRSLGSGSGLGGAGRESGGGGGSGAGAGPGLFDLAEARARTQAAVHSQEIGDLFEYKLKEPITIRKNQSALVPIVQAPVEIERVSIWNTSSRAPRLQRALWLTNSSGVTLDGGSFSVIEEETFAGEGILDAVRPGEKRLLSYATDLALSASSRQESEHYPVVRVRVSRGVMTHENEVREKSTYTVRNEESTARTVIVEHPVRTGYELRGESRPVETTRAWMRFRVPVESKNTASLVVEEARPIEATYTLANISREQLGVFLRERSINQAIEDALQRILRQKEVVAQFDEQKTARESDMTQIFDDQQRLRENMKSLKGSPDEKALLQRYTQRLNQQEDRLEALRKEIQSLEKEEESAQAQLDRMIDELTFDVKL